jgi:hypothetical protein
MAPSTRPATAPDTSTAPSPQTQAGTQPTAATQPADQQTLVRAALHVLGGRLKEPGAFISNDKQPVLHRLAVAEGLKPPIDNIELCSKTPMLLRAQGVAIMREPEPALLEPLWGEAVAPMRDLACVIAAKRFSDEQNRALIETLLPAYDDDKKMGGAILAGLTDLRTELLEKRAAVEDVWTVRKIMHLALWMQGEQPAMSGQVAPLLHRDELPRSTLLLALLHRRPGPAMEDLFHEPGYTDGALIRLFEHYRWWSVLKRYWPHRASPPRFWYWADRPLQRFQMQVLRNWYLLHRHRLTGRKPRR